MPLGNSMEKKSNHARHSKMTFIKSASNQNSYPHSLLPEIALAGRSNSGKSSLLNALSNQKIAKVSATPGKTQLLNFFELDKKYYLVDMPGYGYAKRSKKEILVWKNMIETYLSQRQSLVGLILVMDIRRKWAIEESQLLDWLDKERLSRKNIIIVLNKSDKLSKNLQIKQAKEIQLNSRVENVFAISCKKKIGISDLQKYIFKTFNPKLELGPIAILS